MWNLLTPESDKDQNQQKERILYHKTYINIVACSSFFYGTKNFFPRSQKKKVFCGNSGVPLLFSPSVERDFFMLCCFCVILYLLFVVYELFPPYGFLFVRNSLQIVILYWKKNVLTRQKLPSSTFHSVIKLAN